MGWEVQGRPREPAGAGAGAHREQAAEKGGQVPRREASVGLGEDGPAEAGQETGDPSVEAFERQGCAGKAAGEGKAPALRERDVRGRGLPLSRPLRFLYEQIHEGHAQVSTHVQAKAKAKQKIKVQESSSFVYQHGFLYSDLSVSFPLSV